MGGATVGGIGVSGGNAPGRDDEIARAGLGVAEALSPSIPVQSAQSAPLPYSGASPASSVYSAPSMPQPINKVQHEFPRSAASTQQFPSDMEDPYRDEDSNQFNQ